jgi:protein-tyrosine phosphatase
MGYRHLLTLLGCALIGLGVINGGWFIIAIWLGLDFLILGFAHSRGAHGVFGKRFDGSLPLWSWLLFLPLHAYTEALWRVARWFSREPACNAVSETLVVGRRLLASEREGDFENYIDLTAEFAEPLAVRRSPSYRSFPILDGSAPSPESLRAVVAGLKDGRTFIHCAQGHGRTGLFALAVLLKQGVVQNVDEGLGKLQTVRPGIRLNEEQHACIQKYADDLA